MKGKRNPAYRHGLCGKHPLYAVWMNMKNRCRHKKLKSYKNYGGRGIRVYSAWNNDFYAFFNWAIKNGWKQGLTIDRRNNNKNYTPSNCRFVDRITQGRNQRTRSTNKYPRGVSFNSGSFRVRVTVNKKTIFIGRFKTKSDSVSARKNFIKNNNLKDFHS